MSDWVDIKGDALFIGDVVVASRPSGSNSSKLEYCRVSKINYKTKRITLEPIDFETKLRKTRTYGDIGYVIDAFNIVYNKNKIFKTQ